MLKVPSKTIGKAICFLAFLFIVCKLKCSRNEFVYRSYCVATLAQFVTVARLNVLKLAIALSLQLEFTFNVHLTLIQHEISIECVYFLKGIIHPKKETSVITYPPTHHSNSVWLSFFR